MPTCNVHEDTSRVIYLYRRRTRQVICSRFLNKKHKTQAYHIVTFVYLTAIIIFKTTVRFERKLID